MTLLPQSGSLRTQEKALSLEHHFLKKPFRYSPLTTTYRRYKKNKGRTIYEIRDDRPTLTCLLYEMMVKRESGLRATELTFLDRALPDGLAYYRFAGLNPNEILSDCFQYRYASVFMLNRLPYQRDGVRTADDPTAVYFDSWISRDYSALGYNVVRVPVLSPEERLAFVLERLSEQGLI